MDSRQTKIVNEIAHISKAAINSIGNAKSNQVATSSASHQSLSPFFTLNLDCCDEIFALLPLADLHALGQTCRMMQQATGEYFQNNFRASKIAVKHSSFRLGATSLIGFGRFIEKLWIDGGIEDFQFAGEHCHNGAVKEIYFDLFALSAAKIDCIKGILANIESVLLTDCIMPGDFYETFLKLCPKLCRLSVLCYDGFQNQWLFQKYPTLEYLKLSGQIAFQFDDIKQFFVNNSNVQQFAIDGRYLLENRRSIIDAKIKWHDLVASLESNYAENMDVYTTLFMELHTAGSYQRLHLFLNGKHWDESIFQQLPRVPAIVNLCLDYFSTELNMQIIKDLRKFEVFRPLNVPVNELQRFASDLPNLERVVFREASSTEILPFICLAKRLKEIRVCWLKCGIYFDKYLDLAKLNCEREKLNGAQRMIIYVDERIYVTTKRILGQIRFNSIEMRRISAYESKTFYASFL